MTESFGLARKLLRFGFEDDAATAPSAALAAGQQLARDMGPWAGAQLVAPALPQATILSPGQTVLGLSQAELGDAWWQKIYAIPLQNHFGLFDDRSDPRGRRGSVEKALAASFGDSVLFVGGAFGEITNNIGTDGTLMLQRSIVLPNQGKATVFFPLLNGEFENLVNKPGDPDNLLGNKTVGQLQGLLDTLFDPATEGGSLAKLFASVDGRPVLNSGDYRQASEDPFHFTTPFPTKDSLLSVIGYSDTTYLDNVGVDPIPLSDLAVDNAVTVSPVVADGYWLAVQIPGGDHALNFGGTLANDGVPFFSLDTTYSILNPIEGSNQTDALIGKASNDYMNAANGNDLLFGGSGDDLLLGGKGGDLLVAGAGRDELWGDAGKDLFVFQRGDGEDTIFDFSQGETVLTQPRFATPQVRDITLASGVTAAQIDFGGGDILTFAGLASANLVVVPGEITYA